MIEVLVALIVISVGLLGIARLQATVYSSTNVASKRSLAAIEADSMAASMHVNRGYWTNADVAGATITAQGTAVAVAAGAPNLATSIAAAPNCASTATPCAVTDMAAYDLAQWAGALQVLLPNYTGTINCGAITPITCTININWNENSVAVNSQEAAAQASSAAAAFENPSYTLYVQP